MGGKRWTNADKTILVAMAKCGDSAAEIADATGRTVLTVRKQAQLLGYSLRGGNWRVDVGQRARLLDYLVAHPGATLADFARACGRTRQTVGAMARHLTREGLLRRTGSSRLGVRYVVVPGKWVRSSRRAFTRV